MTAHTTPTPTEESTSPRLLTVEEAAQRLRIGRTLGYALAHEGSIESVRIGRLRRVTGQVVAGVEVAAQRSGGARWSVGLALGLRQGEALGLRR